MEGNCDIEKCEWAIIPGYDGVYSISSDGQVRNNVRGRNLRLKNSTKGYKRIDLNKNGKAKSYMVHRLVAASFIPNPNEKEQVNHINGIKWDNRKENLE